MEYIEYQSSSKRSLCSCFTLFPFSQIYKCLCCHSKEDHGEDQGTPDVEATSDVMTTLDVEATPNVLEISKVTATPNVLKTSIIMATSDVLTTSNVIKTSSAHISTVLQDIEVRCEALSELMGVPVKPLSVFQKENPGETTATLSVENFLISAILDGCDVNSKLGAGRGLDGPGAEFFVDEEEFFDPVFDFDFTDLPRPTSVECLRGDEPYERPYGWYRMALKVCDKYPDGNTWLGMGGWRSQSDSGEWPVSYHGTNLQGSKSIIRSHYKAGFGQVYGRGIYSTPNLDVTTEHGYAKTFQSQKTNKTFKVVLQNRINTDVRKICENKEYWLIPVPDWTTASGERDIVRHSIRPYGILIKEFTEKIYIR